MRLFVAVDVPEPLCVFAAQLSGRLKNTGAAIKSIPAGNMHLTLHFLGEVPVQKLALVKSALNSAAANAPFALEPSGLGYFGGKDEPHIIWLGLQQGAVELAELHKIVGDRLAAAGFALDERPFTAHLTLGRVKGPIGREELAALLKKTAVLSGAPVCAAETATLYESNRSPSGPQYVALHTIRFGVAK